MPILVQGKPECLYINRKHSKIHYIGIKYAALLMRG